MPETYLKRNYGIDDFIPPKSGRMYAASNINGNANDFSVYDICSKSNKDIVAQTLDGPLNTSSFDGDLVNTFMNHNLASPHKSLI